MIDSALGKAVIVRSDFPTARGSEEPAVLRPSITTITACGEKVVAAGSGSGGPSWSALTISGAVWRLREKRDWHDNFFLVKFIQTCVFPLCLLSLTGATHYKLPYAWKAAYVRRLRKLLRGALGLSLIFSLCAFCLLLYARANCVSSGIWHVLIQTCDGKRTHSVYWQPP